MSDNMYFKWAKELHWSEYGAEFLGTAFLVFVGVSAVVFDFGKGLPLPNILPDVGLRRLITGLIFAGCAPLIAISPWGRLSGGHVNPSISLAFWAHGKMHHHDLIGYLISQFLGAFLGEVLVLLVWGPYAKSVSDGITMSGFDYPLWVVFLAEMALTALLVLVIFTCVSSRRFMHWTPLFTWLLVATMVWLESPISGTSLNPARSTGPALFSGQWNCQWLYWIAPPLGALIAVGLYRLLAPGNCDVMTGKLCHHSSYRSIFKNVSALDSSKP
jgi:aquaporin Z